jgi:diguanylate cyclase (GGDEF)-like protein
MDAAHVYEMRDHAMGHPALTDLMTGLANRLHFELVYSYLFQAGDRGMALTVLLLSFGTDDFESSDPDTLRRLGERLQKTIRSADLAGHLGHGRVVVLLFSTNMAGGLTAADRVEQAVTELNLGQISIGLAVFQDGMKDPSALLEAADRALRAAEEAGEGVELV